MDNLTALLASQERRFTSARVTFVDALYRKRQTIAEERQVDEKTDKEQVGDALVALIGASLPMAEQTTKWNAPNFVIDGRDLITLNFSPKNPVRIVFHRGSKAVDTKTGRRLLADETGRLTWATDQRAYASFPDLSSVMDGSSWLTDFCQKWVVAATQESH
jgi:hypothetical protein